MGSFEEGLQEQRKLIERKIKEILIDDGSVLYRIKESPSFIGYAFDFHKTEFEKNFDFAKMTETICHVEIWYSPITEEWNIENQNQFHKITYKGIRLEDLIQECLK